MSQRSTRAILLLALGASMLLGSALSACSSEDEAPAVSAPAPDYEKPGPHPVGHAFFSVEDSARGRTLPVQLWYPSAAGARAAAEAGVPLEELHPEGAERATLKDLISKAPERCTTRRTRSAPDAEPAAGAFPLVVFSHCWGCLRFSASTMAERLASHGIAVVAPDHAGGTLFEQLAGNIEPVGEAFLLVRVGDVQATLGATLDPANNAIPERLRGRFDETRVGVMGHSFGALTAGKVLHDDPRFKAGFAMAAPPSFLGVKMAEIQAPLFFLLAQEDNSIGAIGNKLIRGDYEDTSKSWLAEVKDAGHWSFSDICALTDAFQPGCGKGKRQDDKSDFDYLDIDTGRGVAASYAAAFFAATLLQDAAAERYIGAAHPEAVVQLSKK